MEFEKCAYIDSFLKLGHILSFLARYFNSNKASNKFLEAFTLQTILYVSFTAHFVYWVITHLTQLIEVLMLFWIHYSKSVVNFLVDIQLADALQNTNSLYKTFHLITKYIEIIETSMKCTHETLPGKL